jgi:hypothetical protein
MADLASGLKIAFPFFINLVEILNKDGTYRETLWQCWGRYRGLILTVDRCGGQTLSTSRVLFPKPLS